MSTTTKSIKRRTVHSKPTHKLHPSPSKSHPKSAETPLKISGPSISQAGLTHGHAIFCQPPRPGQGVAQCRRETLLAYLPRWSGWGVPRLVAVVDAVIEAGVERVPDVNRGVRWGCERQVGDHTVQTPHLKGYAIIDPRSDPWGPLTSSDPGGGGLKNVG